MTTLAENPPKRAGMTTLAENPLILKAASLWDSEFFGFDAPELEVAAALRQWLPLSRTKLGSYLAKVERGSQFVRFESSEVVTLQRAIQQYAPRKQDAAIALRMISKMIYRLNLEGKARIAPTRPYELVKLEKNKSCARVVQAQRLLEQWRQARWKWIASLIAHKSDRTNLPSAVAILSGVLDGEILDVDLALALEDACLSGKGKFAPATVREPGSSAVCHGIYIDLRLPWQGMPEEEDRRWYGSLIQASLFARIRKESSIVVPEKDISATELRSARTKALFQAMREGLAKHGVAAGSLPRSFSALIKTVVDAFFTEAPQLIIEYWIRRAHSRSLRPSCIGRITGLPSTLLEKSLVDSATALLEQSGETPELPALKKASRRRPSSVAEPFWLTFLRRAFNAGDGRAVAKALDVYDPPRNLDFVIGRHLVEFARLLVTSEASSGNRWEPETVEACVLTVARRLGTLFPADDPAKKTSRELERNYWQAIEDSLRESRNPRSMQRAVAWAIREFHRFLLTKGGPPVDENSLFRPLRGLIGVDARVCSLDDVYAMVDYLKYKAKASSEAVRAAAIAELIFGFGAGLRRMEGLGLRKIDWPNGTYSMVLVREWEMRGLKTPNAFRWLPLALFIPEDLLKEAEAWRKFAKFVESGDHLFRVSDSEADPVREHEVIGLITEAMCCQMKDDSYHYHLLRHSFAHWFAMRCMLSELGNFESDVSSLFAHLPRTRDWLQHSSEFCLALYGNDSVTNDHGWALATLMGHCSPEIAITHYVHSLDIIGFLFAQRAFGGASDEHLLLALGLPERTRQVHRDDARETAIKFLKRRFPSITTAIQKEQEPCWIDQVHGVIDQHRKTLQPIDQIAPYFHLPVAKAIGFQRRSQEIFCGHVQLLLPKQDGIYLPPKPSAQYRGEVLELAKNIEVAATKDPQSADIAVNALQYLISQSDGQSSAVRFDNVERAIVHVRFLHNAKIGRDGLRFVLRGASKGSEEARPFEKEFGRRLKFLPPRSSDCVTLTIEPIHRDRSKPEIKDGSTLPFVGEAGSDGSGSVGCEGKLYSREAFAFVMQMAAIAFCPPDSDWEKN